jgi:hypothetical protein
VAGRGYEGELKEVSGEGNPNETENKLSFLEYKNVARILTKISPHTYKEQVQY